MSELPSGATGVTMKDVTKRYRRDDPAAVDHLTLEIAAGEICVLVGPSGCGKTTALRMINRLIEPTSGQIDIGGVDARSLAPAMLRRRIGYVIQQVGLLPHLSVGANVATVPRLLGWERERTSERVVQMLELVGLPAGEYARRFPRELSGGQQQRVGLARALAGDPPVMLMDEPFSAVDPLTRDRLQEDFLELHRAVAKTVVFVTHDIDEAVRMADRIAVMRDGRLVQYARPADLLAAPADDFVRDFVGADRALKRLSLVRLADLELAGDVAADGLPRIDAETNVRDALSTLLGAGASAAVVTRGGTPVGAIDVATIARAAAVRDGDLG